MGLMAALPVSFVGIFVAALLGIDSETFIDLWELYLMVALASLVLGAVLWPFDMIVRANRESAEEREKEQLLDRVRTFRSEHEGLRRELAPTLEQLHDLANYGQDLVSDLRSWTPVWIDDEHRTWARQKAAEINATLDHLQVVRASDGTGKGSSEDLRVLSMLRAEGLINEEEFAAFTARFRSSDRMRVREVLDGIEQLQRLRSSGGLSPSNYSDAVWGLLDKLNRRT